MSTPILERPAAPAGPRGDHAASTVRRGFRHDIQGLRAVAVLLVIFFHAGVPGLDGGYVGVDVFFVISGFLITGVIRHEITRTGRLRFGRFYARRARRLLPSAAVVIVATMVMALVWGPPLQLRSTATDAVFSAFYAINFRLAAKGVDYQNATGPESPLQHFWSLAVEEQFYLLWPLLLVIAVALLPRFRTAALLAVVTAATGLSLWYSIHLTTVAAPQAYFSVFTRGWEFGIGAIVVLSAAFLDRVPAVVRDLVAWAGLATIVASAFVFDATTPFPGDAALVPVLGAAAVLACGSGSGHGPVALLRHRPFQLVGTVSYGWYLWHWPLLVLLPNAFGTTFGWLRNLEVAALALWLAGITYLLLETLARKPLPHPGRWLVRGVGFSAVAAVVALAVPLLSPATQGAGAPATPLTLARDGEARLTAALATASERDSVPSNLTPDLAEAADDAPVTNSLCHLSYLQTTSPDCVFGDVTATRTVVLFGDSHAQQWHAALDAAGKNAGYRVVAWTKAACPVADVELVDPTLQRAYTECTVWRADTVARIAAMHPALVLVSQSDTVPGAAMSNATWSQATAATVTRLRAAADQVVFFADTPIPPGDVPACVAAHLDDVLSCSLPAQAAYTGSDVYEQRHTEVRDAVTATGVEVFDPGVWLCSETRCPAVVGNVLVYRDDSHVTDTFSRTVSPLLRAAMHMA